MENDLSLYYKVLGISGNAGLKEIKAAYRSRVRKFHPDLPENRNILNNHLRLIQLNLAYNSLKLRFQSSGAPRPPQEEQQASSEVFGEAISGKRDSLTLYKDPAYSYYKRGHRYYSQINPSRWIFLQEKGLDELRSSENWTDEVIRRIEETIDFFPKAYYYFSIVVGDYPHCSWFADAKEKMRKIEILTPIYMKILASYREEYS